MFDIGLGEMVVIAFVAVLVFGPDKLPELMRQAGAVLQQLRRFATNARDEIRDELGPEYSSLELRDLDPRVIVRKQIAEAMAEEPEPKRPGQMPLGAGEMPPYDADAT